MEVEGQLVTLGNVSGRLKTEAWEQGVEGQ